VVFEDPVQQAASPRSAAMAWPGTPPRGVCVSAPPTPGACLTGSWS
jgi:hypothetical protein